MKNEFNKILFGLFEIYDKEATPSKIKIYWSTLGHYPIEHIRLVTNAWVRKNRFMPKPADLIKLLGGHLHLSADEAWAIAVMACDETNTIVWTQEIASAWSLAKVVYNQGDKIGSRRTFIETYERLLDRSVISDNPFQIMVSMGTDKQKRNDALSLAVNRGLLSVEAANSYYVPDENSLSLLKLKASDLLNGKIKRYVQNTKKLIKAVSKSNVESEAIRLTELP